jgi:hypothetical protein
MKLDCRFLRPLLPRLSALLLIGLVRLPLTAAEPAEAAPDHAEERKVLEMDLARFYGLLKQDPDPRTKVTLIGYQRDYAARANKLLENFDAAKYDELRYDINLQCQRLARKLAPLLTPPATMASAGDLEIAVYELTPSPTDAAEVKAALNIVDVTIKRMEARLSRMNAGSTQYAAEQSRLQRVKERRAALGKEFTQSGWDGLASELRPQG